MKEEIRKLDILFITPIPLFILGLLLIIFLSEIFILGLILIIIALSIAFYSFKYQLEMVRLIEKVGGMKLYIKIKLLNKITLGVYYYFFYFKYYRSYLLGNINIKGIKNKLVK